MRSLDRRVLLLVIDQLAGHWAEGVKVHGDIPPANIDGYHRLGLIPHFSALIDDGLWIRRAWNRGECDTSHGMKYLANGCYNRGNYWGPDGGGRGSFYREAGDGGLFEAAKNHYEGRIKVAVFTTGYWIAKGYFYVDQDMHALPGYYPDELMWEGMALPWLERNPDWDLVNLYFSLNDTVSFCPSYNPSDPHRREGSKHAYLLYLDQLLGEVMGYLMRRGQWEETCLIVASDHGYHLGCSTARQRGATAVNLCCDHPPPHDCVVWDFAEDQPTGAYSGCSRRTTFIVSGGGLEEGQRKRIIEEAQIIDIAPTIADILKLEYRCEGRSVLRQ